MHNSEWRDMRCSTASEFVRRLYMLVTFPLRRPLMTVWIFAGCIAMVLCLHAPLLKLWNKYSGVPQVNEVVKAKDITMAYIESKVKNVKDSLTEIMPASATNKASDKTDDKKDKSKEPRFVAWNVKKFNHVKLTKKKPLAEEQDSLSSSSVNELKNGLQFVSEYAGKLKKKIADKYADFEKMSDNDNVAIRNDNVFEVEDNYYVYDVPTEEVTVNIRDLYYEKSALHLDYLSLPEIWEGEIDVLTPNSFQMGDSLVYLYGIYSTPYKYDTEEAQDYLEKVSKNKEIKCYVVAFTRETRRATALCFVDGVFINQDMVERNLAKNVALR